MMPFQRILEAKHRSQQQRAHASATAHHSHVALPAHAGYTMPVSSRSRFATMPPVRSQTHMRNQRRKPWGFHGAEDTLGSIGAPDVMYGMLPMGIVVAAGLWMALRG